MPAGEFSGPAEVTGILPTGGSWILELETEGDKLFLTTHQPPEVELGEKVRFFVKPKVAARLRRGRPPLANADGSCDAGDRGPSCNDNDHMGGTTWQMNRQDIRRSLLGPDGWARH